MNKLKQEIDLKISEFCSDIIQEPFLSFSEADLQQILTEKFRSIKSLKRKYQTRIARGEGSRTYYKTSRVHREYGGGNRTRLDIVIFKENDLLELSDHNFKKKNGEYLNPMFAFELGTEKSSDIKHHFQNDVQKLDEVVKNGGQGYLIHIHKDVTRSASGTAMRRKTEEKLNSIKRVFGKPCSNQIKIVSIFLRLSRKQKRVLNKCVIYSKVEKKYMPVNVNNKQKIIKNILAELQ